ncbi:MAG: hypothetical protein ACFFDS_00190 [Candidatus Thorarchaeota archaeon]
MNSGIAKKTGLLTVLFLFLLIPFTNASIAENSTPVPADNHIEQSNVIQAFNGNISSTYIVRGETISFYGTVLNYGDLNATILSFNAEFIHLEGNNRFNRHYSVSIDADHRNLGPRESFTGTLRDEITNPESTYNVSVYFVVEDVYDADTEFGAPAWNFTAAENIIVTVIDITSPSGIIVGIGVTFGVIVAIVVVIILYGWLKERFTKRKH